MMLHLGQSRPLQGARHCSNPNVRRWFLTQTYLAVGFLFLLLCTTTTVSASSEAKGGGILSFGKEARARLSRWFGRRSPSEADEPEAEQVFLRNPSRARFTVADRTSFPGDEETSVSEGSSGVEMNFSAKREVALKAQVVYQESDLALKDPLSPYIPPSEGLIFRHSAPEGEHDFKLLQRQSYVEPGQDSIGYLVTSESSDSYLLRFICIPWKRGTVDEVHVVKALKARFAAALKSVNRLPHDRVEDLTEKGVRIPQFAGTVLSLPEAYTTDSLACGKYAFLYPASILSLHDLLAFAELSRSAMMYLTLRAVKIVADLHAHELAHQALTTRSFLVDDEGDLQLLLEDDLSEGSTTDELATLLGPSGSPGEAAATAMETTFSDGRAPGSSNASYHDVFPQPSSSQPYSSGIGSNDIATRLKKRSSADSGDALADAQERDGWDLGQVLFAIWCGIPEKTLQAEPLKTSTLRRRQKVSFKLCKEPPPSPVRKLIKALQDRRASKHMLPEEAVKKSEVFSKFEEFILQD